MRKWLDLFEGHAAPDLLWHGSDQKVETPYHPLTHFGTDLAAHQRAMAVVRDWKRQPEPTYTIDGPVLPPQTIWLHPVHVRITNALTIYDFNNFEHTPIKLVDMLYYQLHVLEQWERNEIFTAGKYGSNRNEPAGVAKLIEIMANKGYDGFVYRNGHEDPGSLSWVNFYPEQVASAGEPQSEILAEGDVVDLRQHKMDKAATEYAGAIGGIIQGERNFFAQGKFIPFAESYIESGFNREFKPEILLDVSIKNMAVMKAHPELKEFVKELRAQRFKVQVTKYHRDSTMTDEQKDGPWGRKQISLDELRAIWAEREHSPYGAYQPSRGGFRTSHQENFDERGIGFNISVGGIDARRGDKYGGPNREEHHIIDNDKDFQEVMEMFALIRRAQIKSV